MAIQMRYILTYLKTKNVPTIVLRSSILHKNNSLCLRTISLQGCTGHHNFYMKGTQRPRILEGKCELQREQRRYMSTPEEKQKSDEARIRGLRKGLIYGAIALVACGLGVRRLEKVLKDADEKEYRSIGDLAIGGPWALTGFDGSPISSADFKGNWYLLYFGFTHCPDICPDELDKISSVMTELSKNPKMPKIKTVFVSVDPERDSPEVMKEYCSEFHEDLFGATGTREEVGTVCRLFRVYYSRGPEDDDGDYVVDHTIISYLMAPNGATKQYFGQNRKVPDMVKEITTLVIGQQTTFLQTIQKFLGLV